MDNHKYTAVLTIAGSDSGGGAGIQADLKTFSALGCFGTSAITAITVQNTCGVKAIHSIPVEIVQGQIEAVMTDIKPSAIKIGMVHNVELVKAVATELKKYVDVPIIFDPVMVSTSGHQLIEAETIQVLQAVLFPLATLITPNLDEAAILANMKINTVWDMEVAALKIIGSGCKAVLLKGGHLKTTELTDLLYTSDGYKNSFETKYIDTKNTHGTGCTLSSAIAVFIADGQDLPTAIGNAKAYVHEAILQGSDVKTGEGHGPVNHFFNPRPLIKIKL